MNRHVFVRLTTLVILVGGALGGPIAPSSATSDVTQLTDPVNAGSSGSDAFVAVTAVEAFEESGGAAVFEPGTEFEEVFTYDTADRATNRLVGLNRPSAVPHAAGAIVVPADVGEHIPVTAQAGDLGAEAPALPASSSATTPCDDVSPSCDEIIAEVCSEGLVCDIVQDPGSLCAEGSVCDIVRDPGSLCAEGSVCDVVEDPESLCEDPADPLVANVCEAPEDPVDWSACDIENTDASCPDPEDAVDVVYGVDNPLSDLECTASTEGPWISQQGGMVRGRGGYACGESVDSIEVRVCLHWRSGGAWVKLGCRYDFDFLFGSNSLEKKIAEACVRQQTVKYRIRAHGEAQDGQDFDQDTASGIDELYCPGTDPDEAIAEAGDYADSWTPGSG